MDKLMNPGLWMMVLIISVVGVITKLVYYRIGILGKNTVSEHIPSLTDERWESIKNQYDNYGPVVLLLASIPAIGSAVAAAAGVFNIAIGTFILIVLISNLIRNWILVFVVGQSLNLLPIFS